MLTSVSATQWADLPGYHGSDVPKHQLQLVASFGSSGRSLHTLGDPWEKPIGEAYCGGRLRLLLSPQVC